MGKRFDYVSRQNTVLSVIEHPAFEGFGEYILPLENKVDVKKTQLDNIRPLLPFHNQLNPDTTVSAINYMIDEINDGKTIFYDFYNEAQKREDPEKESTGLFYFRGKPEEPFAVICPGGGLNYVGSIHEGFPYAIELASKGYNAFVLKYRVGGEQIACEDLAEALAFIFNNAASLEVGIKNYSVWGSSAGARMAANIGSYGAESYGVGEFAKPCMTVMLYTGHSKFTNSDPPTFVAVSDDDTIVNVEAVEAYVENKRKAGLEVEYHRYSGAGHGFGLGIGTQAEGWIYKAIEFWGKQLTL